MIFIRSSGYNSGESPTTTTTTSPNAMAMSSSASFNSPLRNTPMLNREDSIDGTLNGGSSGKAMMASESTDLPGVRKKRYPTDRPYFIAKEILMTERTYKKDLEVINLVSVKLG